jgi:hypothetical protein
MNYKLGTILFGMLVGQLAMAQDSDVNLPDPCTVEPVYHCAENLDGETVIAHFGYRRTCPITDKPFADGFIQIGENNYFSPGPIDRGQPKVFVEGEHVDEFEVEFTVNEVLSGTIYSWTVNNLEVRVDFSQAKDAFMECSVPLD